MNRFNWKNEMPEVPESVHITVMEALEQVQNLSKDNITHKERRKFYRMKKTVAVAGLLLCFLTLSAFAYGKLSGIAGDEVGFAPIYKGDGIFEITVTNDSDRDFKLQEQVRVMRWSSAEEVEGNADKIVFENRKIAAHSAATIVIDLSKGYDITALEEPLPSGDWYYLVLTNNNFAFGQDWMCGIDFDENSSDAVIGRPVPGEKH